MSVDKSLKLARGMARQRSVLTRPERLVELLEAGKWKEGESILGLPKVKVRRVKRRQKAAKAEAAPGAVAAPGAAAPAAAAPGAAPAKGAKPAAPAKGGEKKK